MSVLTGNLVARVAEIIPRYSMLSPGDRVGVAVSGGADSVALLHILHELTPSLGIELCVLHVNHQLRGPESDEDEAFVRQTAESLGLPVIVEQAPVGSGNLEEEARLARRAVFRRCMELYHLNRVALGHTRSDQAETVLFRLLRGTGLAGLAAMQPVTADGLIRPLLTSNRDEVRAWTAGHRIFWREDASNKDTRFTRNRLRNEAIPYLSAAFNPNLEGVLARAAELARDEEDYWIQQIEPIYAEITKRTPLGSIFHVSALNSLHRAIQRRIVRRAVAEIRGNLRSIDMEHVEAILAICTSRHGHDRVIVPGVDALRSFDRLLLAPYVERPGERRHYRFDLKEGTEYELPFRAGFISVNPVSPAGSNCVNFEEAQQFSTEVVDLERSALAEAGGCLAVRNWEPGDTLQRFGHQAPEKVKTLFQEQKVLLWERRHWPVVVAGDQIVWVRRFGGAAKFSGSAEKAPALRLRYRPAME